MDMSVSMDKIFSAYRGETIALYGLGMETKRMLHYFGKDFEIAGLLDSFRSGGELYGRRIISFSDAVNAGVKRIIVIARPGSCRAIAKRIGNQCRENGIALMDIRGKDLLVMERAVYSFSDINGLTKAELEEKIANANIVSFDLFDTLVMRQTLYSDDVAEYVDCRLREKGIYIKDFCIRRLGSEKELSRNTAPTLTEIYADIAAGETITAEQLANMEWEIDFGLLVPRKEVCSIFRETVARGKKVYVISDTYYSKIQIAKILEKCDITEYADILTSSDYRIGKTQGLYRFLSNRKKNKGYLHIGDDVVADIESARVWGFETCRLLSGLDLLQSVGNLGLLDDMATLSDRLRIGMFVAKIFNSPFQFESEDKNIKISGAYEIGYLLCAPVISDFVLWFYERMNEQGFQNVWFAARDGYLIKKMYDYLLKLYGQEKKTVYFLTSRLAAVRAGMRDEKDIRYVDDMKFSGTLKENLKERFGIDGNGMDNESGLMQYKDIILESSRKAYENYQKYLSQLVIGIGDIAFFDFVAKGTTQMYVQRMISNRMKGFYFLQLETEQMKQMEVDIQTFYENGRKDFCAVYENYYILEALLTASHPTVTGFDEGGKPVYAVETREYKDILCFEQAQEGILDYFMTYIELCPKGEKTVNKKLDECLLELIHRIRIANMDFLDMVIEDPFFNRLTKVADVL